MLIVDIAESLPDLIPGHRSLPRHFPVSLSQVQVAELIARLPDRRRDVVLLDAHMERIQHDLHIFASHRVHIADRLVAGIEQITLEPVQHFHSEHDIAFFRDFRHLLHIGDRSLKVSLLIDGLRVIHRPVGVKSSAQRLDVHFFQLM